MTKEEKKTIDGILEKVNEVLEWIADHEKQTIEGMGDVRSQIDTVRRQLFGNGTKRGSFEERLSNIEKDIHEMKEKEWTKENHASFESVLKKQLKEIDRRLGTPWRVIAQILTISGAWLAALDLILKH